MSRIEVIVGGEPENVRELVVASELVGCETSDAFTTASSAPFGGGYAYSDSADGPNTRNRMITWRCQGCVLELRETSLDVDLSDAILRVRFPAPIVPSIAVYEATSRAPLCVYIIVATTRGVHRLVFPHPDALRSHQNAVAYARSHSRDPAANVASVLAAATQLDMSNASNHVAIRAHTSGVVCAAGAGPSAVALGCRDGSVLVMRLADDSSNTSDEYQLRHTSTMQRLFTGFVPRLLAATGLGADDASVQTCVSLGTHITPAGDALIFALTATLHLQIWSATQRRLILDQNTTQWLQMPAENDIVAAAATASASSSSAYDGLVLRVHSTTGSPEFLVCVHLPLHECSQFLVLSGTVHEGDPSTPATTPVSLSLRGCLHGQAARLVDLVFDQYTLWALWDGVEAGTSACAYASLLDRSTELTLSSTQSAASSDDTGLSALALAAEHGPWTDVHMTRLATGDEVLASHEDPAEAVCQYVLAAGRMPRSTVRKALQLFSGSTAPLEPSTTETVVQLRARIIETVQMEAHSAEMCATSDAIDDVAAGVASVWARFYDCCLQYWAVANGTATALVNDPRTGLTAVLKRHLTGLLRPCDTLETYDVVVNESSNAVPPLHLGATATGDHVVGSDVGVLGIAGCFGGANEGATASAGLPRLLACCRFAALTATTPCLRALERELVCGTPALEAVRVHADACSSDSFSTTFLRLVRAVAQPMNTISLLLHLLDAQATHTGASGSECASHVASNNKGSRDGHGGHDDDDDDDAVFSTKAHASSTNNTGASTADVTATSDDHFVVEPAVLEWFSQLFTSNTMNSAVAVAFGQLMRTRFAVCRDLLIALFALLQLRSQSGLSSADSARLLSEFVPRTVRLMRAYHVMMWLAEQTVTMTGSSSLAVPTSASDSLAGLSSLVLDESMGAQKHSVSGRSNSNGGDTSLLELYLRTHVAHLRAALARQAKGHVSYSGHALVAGAGHWRQLVQPLLACLVESWWPYRNGGAATFLVESEQHLVTLEYVRQLGEATPLLHYCRARAYLGFGAFQQAKECFIEATAGGMSDRATRELIVRTCGQDDSVSLMRYHMRIMRMFERAGAPELVVTFATEALSVVVAGDASEAEHIPVLWSNVFKSSLEMGEYERAYTAIVRNPDASQQRECLRRFLLVLCERNLLAQLCQFPYLHLASEVESFLQWRARNTDVLTTTPSPYLVLYSFHMFRSAFRLAASVMFEYGQRLGVESWGVAQRMQSAHHDTVVAALQGQAKALLGAINALSLVDADHAWLAVPAEYKRQVRRKRLHPSRGEFGRTTDDTVSTDEQPMSTDSLQQPDVAEWKRAEEDTVDFVQVHDIKRDYTLVLARLQLLKRTSGTVVSRGTPPVEILAALVRANEFDTAIEFARSFGLGLHPVFDGLATACAALADGRTHGDDAWLSRARASTPADRAWEILRAHLGGHDSRETNYEYHRCVASRLLGLDRHRALPHWLVASFKRVAPAALLHLWMDYGLLSSAAQLVCEYIDAILGVRATEFAIKNVLHNNGPAVWVPYSAFDRVRAAMREQQRGSDSFEVFERKIDSYLQQVESTK